MAESDSRVSVESDSQGGDKQSYTEIIIVRHGETDWNALAKIQGHSDVDLNETGRQQAAAVADRLSREANISAIYSSDLSRAFETATTIASKFDGLQGMDLPSTYQSREQDFSCIMVFEGYYNGLVIFSLEEQQRKVIKDQGLRERHLGDLQGHVFQPQELMRLCPVAYKAFTSPSLDEEIPVGGESLNQLYERCTSAVERIGDKHKGERVIVVTHGGTIRSLYKRASPKGRPGKVLNTAVSVLHLADGGTWSMRTWNDVSHLNQAGFLNSGFGGDESSG